MQTGHEEEIEASLKPKPADPELEHCANCRYSLLTDTGRYRCRVGGPKGELIQESWDPTRPQSPAKVQTVWPTVLAWDWCGKWEAPRPDDRRSLGGPAVVNLAPSEQTPSGDETPFISKEADDELQKIRDSAKPLPPPTDEDPAATRKRAADEAAGATAPSEQPPLAEVPPGKPDPKVGRGPVKKK